MKVMTTTATRASDRTDDLSLGNPLSRLSFPLIKMGIDRVVAIKVLDDDNLAIAFQSSAIDHGAVVCRLD